MNSLEIQYFLTIVKYGSFTEAAQALSVSQPAISKQIRQLEAELGCSLFARSGRTLSLTEAGQAYYAYFQQCCFQLNLLKNKLEDQKKDGKSTIRIAYPEDVDPAYFRDKIQSAAAALETPVRLEFSCYPEGELTDLLTAGKADLILTGNYPDTKSCALSVHPFSAVSQVLLYAASRPEAAGISDFRNDTFLFSEADAALHSNRNLYRYFHIFGFAPKIRFAANLSTILDLAAQDEGVYLTHAWCRGCKNPDYRMLMLPSEKEFYLAYAKENSNLKICKLLSCITNYLQA